jgi:translocation and assembly module TamB
MKFRWKAKKIMVWVLKVAGWITLSVILLLILVAVAIQIPAVQRTVTQRAIGFLKKKIKTEVRLAHISISFPKKIVLTGLYLEDQAKDTLLYAGELSIDTDLWGLTQHRIELNDVALDNLHGFVSRSAEDSAFNFDYIIQAFTDSTAQENPDTTAQSWDFSIGDVTFDHATVSFKDSLEGNDIAFTVGSLEINTEEFDLRRSIIHVDDIAISDLQATVVQTKEPLEQLSDTAVAQRVFPYDLAFSDIALENIHANYTHHGTGQVMRLDLDKADVSSREIDLKNRIIRLKKFRLLNTLFLYHQMSRDSIRVREPTDTTTSGQPWQLALGELELSGNSFQYEDFNQPVGQKGIDFNHLWISGIAVSASDIQAEGSTMQGDLTNFSFREKSGFSITSFQSSFSLQQNAIDLRDFILETPYSHIALEVRGKGGSFETFASTYPDAEIAIAIKPSSLSFRDVLFFAPSLLKDIPLNLPPSGSIRFSATSQGKVNNLVIDHLTVETLSQTLLHVNGTVRGLPDFEHTEMHLALQKFYTVKKDVESILPDTLLPESLELPQWLSLTGNFDGTIVKPGVKATLTSDFGKVLVNGKMNRDTTVTTENYRGEVQVKDFSLGKLLRQGESMGKLDMRASIAGSGLKVDELDALVDLAVNHFQYKGYDYRDFTLRGSVKKYFFEGGAQLQDENLSFTLKGDLDYNEDIPRYKAVLELKNANLKSLHLTEGEFKVRGQLDVDLATRDFRVMNGHVDIRKFAVFNGKALYAVDSLLFASLDQEGRSELSIRSDIVSGDFRGTINLFSLPDAVRRHFNRYFSLHDPAYDKPVAPQNFEFSLILKNTDLLTEVLFPDLEPFVPGEITGVFDSRNNDLDMRFAIAGIQYDGLHIDSLRFNVNSDKNALTYGFALRKMQLDTLRIDGLKFSGIVADDSIRTRLTVIDSQQEEKYIIGGVINSFKDEFQFRFLPGQLVFKYNEWSAPAGHYLLFGKKGLHPHRMEIAKGEEKIALVRKEGQDSTVSIVFNSLDLENITSLVEGTVPAGGIADGDFNISVASKGAFNSNLTIRTLTILEQEWGDLTLAMGRTATGPFNIDLRVEGDNTELKAAGYYVSKAASPEIHFEVDLTRLNLAVVEPLSFGQLKNVKGQLVGNVKVDGPVNQPDINGVLTFKEASFLATYVNSEFTLRDESLTVQRSGVTFDNFKILDRKDNSAVIDGSITSESFAVFDLNLDVSADNFQLLNSTARDNDLFYGNVSINTRASIRGTSNLPKVTMNASLSDDSDFTYVVPQSEKGVLEQKGIVVFIDKDAKDDPFLASINPRDTVKSSFRGVELTANIELTDRVGFNIVIDPAAGDKLSVKGNSTLTLTMDPTGDMTLAGRYEVTEGAYEMSFYRLVKRKFAIEKGGSITWSGDPLNAMLDLRAVYDVRTSPIELVSNQLTTTDQTELNLYKQQLPFLVYLRIEGELLTPEISFQLDMPERERNAFGGAIYAKIQDINTRESDLNKQVFALLVLKRFMSDNPLESQGGGGGVEGVARRSVSRLLTEQLNQLSKNVKGLELSFDVRSYEDYTTGRAEGQTELQLGVSKTLLNDRLVVKVAGNVDVEGDASGRRDFADYIGDLALEYKLTEDGRLRITGFRNSNYDMIDGELIETGTGLIYIKDYDTLRELFKRNAAEK